MKKNFLSFFLATSTSIFALNQPILLAQDSAQEDRGSAAKRIIERRLEEQLLQEINLKIASETEQLEQNIESRIENISSRKAIQTLQRYNREIIQAKNKIDKLSNNMEQIKVGQLSTILQMARDGRIIQFDDSERDNKLKDLIQNTQALKIEKSGLIAKQKILLEKQTESTKIVQTLEEVDIPAIKERLEIIKKRRGSREIQEYLENQKSKKIKFEKEKNKINKQIQNKREEIAELIKDLEDVRQSQEQMKLLVDNVKNDRMYNSEEKESKIKEIENSINDYRNEINQKESEVSILNSSIGDLESQVELQSKSISSIEETIKGLEAELAVLSNEDNGKSETKVLPSHIEKLSFENLENTLSLSNSLLSSTKNKNAVISKLIKQVDQELKTLDIKIENFSSQLERIIIEEVGKYFDAQEQKSKKNVEDSSHKQESLIENANTVKIKDPERVTEHPSLREDNQHQGKRVYNADSGNSTSLLPTSTDDSRKRSLVVNPGMSESDEERPDRKRAKVADELTIGNSERGKQVHDRHSQLAGDLAVSNRKISNNQQPAIDTSRSTSHHSSTASVQSDIGLGDLPQDSTRAQSTEVSEPERGPVSSSCAGVKCPDEVQLPQYSKEDAQKALEILGMAKDNLPQKQERETLVSRIQAALENSGISNEKLKNDIFKAVKKKLAIDTNRDKVTYENLVASLTGIAGQH